MPCVISEMVHVTSSIAALRKRHRAWAKRGACKEAARIALSLPRAEVARRAKLQASNFSVLSLSSTGPSASLQPSGLHALIDTADVAEVIDVDVAVVVVVGLTVEDVAEVIDVDVVVVVVVELAGVTVEEAEEVGWQRRLWLWQWRLWPWWL